MGSYNRVILMGNLTREPEMRVTAGGMNVGSFALAVNELSRDDKENVSYIDCVAFGKLADVTSELLTKGMPIHVEGRLRQNRWEQDGQKRSKIVVVVDRLDFVGPKKDDGDMGEAEEPETEQTDTF
ncbi:single-stranded DNA-binding protein [Leptospirillum ferriphilum]|uniref:Single-stranded DNA-binding protein n=1 Tax=Leptospirillum ferriphilum TaxID=178606 RepID=A0A1V3SV74_9BACT|nr:single-stranded DNA-binding protein [Leptospirillum ferriphilum]OOH72766.1 hypothetical protein BOX24_05100 [Leptospirillum ferriphilum]